MKAAVPSPLCGKNLKIIQQALGIESDEVVNCTFPKNWPSVREQRARIIGCGGMGVVKS